MAGKARSWRKLGRIIGQMAWPRETAAGAEPWGGGAFAPGTFQKNKGAADNPERTAAGGGSADAACAALYPGRHLQKSAFVDGWFERNRQAVKGRRGTERPRGEKSLGQPALHGL